MQVILSGVNARILVVIHKFLEVRVLFQLVIQPLLGIELLWQLKSNRRTVLLSPFF